VDKGCRYKEISKYHQPFCPSVTFCRENGANPSAPKERKDMSPDSAIWEFKNRNEFRRWLGENHDNADGIWLIFKKGDKGFTANDALEEAICFGWIDSVMKSIDKTAYKKYFSKRKNTEKWSEKNINIFNKLQEGGLMTKAGVDVFCVKKMQEPAVNRDELAKMNIEKLESVLMNDEIILKLFVDTAPSRRKQLAGFYCDAKTEETRKKREVKIIEALKTGNRGMLY